MVISGTHEGRGRRSRSRLGVALVFWATGMPLLLAGCHTPLDPERERPLGTIRNIVLDGIDLSVNNIGRATRPKELDTFSKLVAESAVRELKKAKSFQLLESHQPGRPADRATAHLTLHFTLSDQTSNNSLLLSNRVEGQIRLADGRVFLLAQSKDVNYQSELDRQRILKGKVLPSGEEFMRQVFDAHLSESQWFEILREEAKKGADTLLPDPSAALVGELQHRIEVARGKEELGWIELAQTAAWGKLGQWAAAGAAFLLFCGCWLVAGVTLAISEAIFGEKKDKQAQPGSLIVIGFLLAGFYFLYLTIAAIF